jgi:hypothetical protein
MTESSHSAATPPPAEIVARPSFEYRLRRLVVALILLATGLWCIWDGFVVWPAENAKAQREGQMLPHGGWSVPLNQGLAVIFPPFGLAVALWTYRTSRGRYRLAGTTLSIPGHPPISLDCIRKIDKRLWDRKGLAYLDYEIPGSTRTARFRLDDFAYQRQPTDQILDRIEEHVRALA